MSKDRFLFFTKKILPYSMVIAVIAVIATVMVFRLLRPLPSERVIIFFYQTNVPAMNASEWAEQLKSDIPGAEYTEAQCYTARENSGSSIQSGWAYISARLSDNQGDIFIIPQERFEFLSEKGWLKKLEITELQCDPSRFMTGPGGDVLGVDVSGLCFKGLNFQRVEEPYNVIYPLEGQRAVLCIYAGASSDSLARTALNHIVSSAYEPSNE